MPKKKEAAKKTAGHITEKDEKICAIIDCILTEMQKGDRISDAPLNQLSSALGVLADKLSKDAEDTETAELIKIFKDFKEIK